MPPAADVSYRYEVLSELGSGGMGIVYKARDRETGAVVALKVLHPEIAAQPQLIERFKTELLLARKITHKNVCRVYDLNRFGSVVAISMEYIEGESLRTLLGRVEGLSTRHGLKIIHQVIAGLAEAHAQSVIHRDLKPENILIAQDGTVKVADFGVARSVETGAPQTGAIVGTPAYMSPEQAEGKSVDARTDIYALGLMMYEMFCGQPAFKGDTSIAVALKQVQELPTPPRQLDPYVPEFIEGAILKCIEKSPAKRFQSAGELDAALTSKREAATVAVSDGREPAMPVRLTRWEPRDGLLVPLAVIGLLLFFIFFPRVSLAPRSQISFDGSVLRRIAQEYVQRFNAQVAGQSQIDTPTFSVLYDYIAARAGATAALEITNNPVQYWVWRVQWENGTLVDLDNRGTLTNFSRAFSSDISTEKFSTEESRPLAEKAIREFFNVDTATLNLETAGDEFWNGHPVKSFRWSGPNDDYGLKRNYIVRIFGREIVSLAFFHTFPPDYRRRDSMWQLIPWFALQLVLLILGLFQPQRGDQRSRWRNVVVVFFGVIWGWVVWLAMMGPLVPTTGRSTALIVTGLLALAYGSLTFFALIPIERAVRRTAAAKLSTFSWLCDRRAASEPCGLAILRGTLIGLGLLGMDTFLVWLGTTRLGMSLDSFGVIYLPVRLFVNTTWPGVLAVCYPLVLAVSIALVVALVISVSSRVVSRTRLAMFLALILVAAILPGPTIIMAGVQPYFSKIILLLIEVVILACTFTRFDLLTVTAALFTLLFWSENYQLLLMFRPTGAFEQWLAFGVWALIVAGAAAIAFKSSLLAAYRRFATAFQ